jgi:hypothetical protein
MTTMAIGSEEELVEAQLRDRRARLALSLTRYMAWSVSAIIIAPIILWFFAREHYRFLMIIGPVALVAGSAWLYPAFHRRGQAVTGARFFLVSLLVVTVAALPVIVHEEIV